MYSTSTGTVQRVLSPDLSCWLVRPDDFPPTGSLADLLCFALRYAILAPSRHNTQPWLFAVDDSGIELYADRTRALAVLDPEDRELTISCGAALFNLRVALRYFRFREFADVFPASGAPDLLARIGVDVGGDPDENNRLLFAAIPYRHTNRRPFERRATPESLLLALESAADEEGAWLHIVTPESREEVIDLTKGGEIMLWEDMRFRRELAAWIHPRRIRGGDGIPGYAPGLGDLATMLEPFVAGPSGVAASVGDVAALSESPVLAVLGTDNDDPSSWLAAGQALEHVLLRAQAAGVSASYLNQAIEIPQLRAQLARVLGRKGVPQVMIRLGYGPSVTPTPRRSLGEILYS